MEPTELLTKEHRLILQALEILSAAEAGLEKGEWPKKALFEAGIDFLQSFADRFHHFKEEYLMFGLLAQKKGGAFDADIGALRYQHEQGRRHLSAIKDALDGYDQKDEISASTLLENLAAYVSLLKRHIYQEDRIFFPLIRNEFSDEEKRMLLNGFRQEEDRIGGGGPFFEIHSAMIQKMRAQSED